MVCSIHMIKFLSGLDKQKKHKVSIRSMISGKRTKTDPRREMTKITGLCCNLLLLAHERCLFNFQELGKVIVKLSHY